LRLIGLNPLFRWLLMKEKIQPQMAAKCAVSGAREIT